MSTTISGTSGVTFPDSTSMQTGQQACKAWVNFNGTGTVAIRDSYNVSSITDLGTGQYAMNFTTSMPNVNYSTLATTMPWSGAARNYSAGFYGYAGIYTESSVQLWVESSDGGASDLTVICAAIFSN